MDPAYVFRVGFRLDAPRVRTEPATFETVVRVPAPEPGTDPKAAPVGWLFFRTALWRGEVTDPDHARRLFADLLGVDVEEVTFAELEAHQEYLDALREEIADDARFDDAPGEVVHRHLGSSIRVAGDEADG
ncbi:MAG: LWR-salt protein [Halolamina sp.]